MRGSTLQDRPSGHSLCPGGSQETAGHPLSALVLLAAPPGPRLSQSALRARWWLGPGPRHRLSPAAVTPHETAHFQSPCLEKQVTESPHLKAHLCSRTIFSSLPASQSPALDKSRRA